MNTDEQTKICKRQGGGLYSPLRQACVERGGQPLETLGDHLGVAPNADAEVLGHLEECTGYNASLVNLLQPRAQGVHGAAPQPRKHDGPRFRPDSAEVIARVEKPLEQRAVGFQQRSRVRGDFIQVVEGNYAQPLRRMRGGYAK